MESLFFDYRRGFGRERHERFKESLVAFEIILLLSLLYHATVGTEDKSTRTYVRAAIPVSSAARERVMSRPAEKACGFDYN